MSNLLRDELPLKRVDDLAKASFHLKLIVFWLGVIGSLLPIAQIWS